MKTTQLWKKCLFGWINLKLLPLRFSVCKCEFAFLRLCHIPIKRLTVDQSDIQICPFFGGGTITLEGKNDWSIMSNAFTNDDDWWWSILNVITNPTLPVKTRLRVVWYRNFSDSDESVFQTYRNAKNVQILQHKHNKKRVVFTAFVSSEIRLTAITKISITL